MRICDKGIAAQNSLLAGARIICAELDSTKLQLKMCLKCIKYRDKNTYRITSTIFSDSRRSIVSKGRWHMSGVLSIKQCWELHKVCEEAPNCVEKTADQFNRYAYINSHTR